jgi:hypothetical protein
MKAQERQPEIQFLPEHIVGPRRDALTGRIPTRQAGNNPSGQHKVSSIRFGYLTLAAFWVTLFLICYSYR